MIKKLLILLLLCSPVFGQWKNGIKPMLGRQIDWSHPLARGLVGCWLMNEGGGTIVNDLSGNGNTGIIYDLAETSWISGMYGPAIRFNGENNSYIIVASNGTISLFPELTVVYCFKDTIDLSAQVTTQFYITDSLTTQLRVRTNDLSDTSWLWNVGVDVRDGNWRTICAAYDGAAMKGYIDGVYNDEEAKTGTIALTGLSFDMGRSPYGNSVGDVSHCFLYNRALSASKIAYLYRSPFCMFEVDL